MFYHLSLGTNINPEQNAVNMVVALTGQFGHMTLFPFVYTPPQDIYSNAHFLNSVAIIHCHFSPEQVKQHLNQIETRLGRDRTDPHKSKKDRTADIDILDCQQKVQLDVFYGCESDYVRLPAQYRLPAVDLSAHGLPTFERAATVYLDTGSRHIRVIDEGHDCLVDG